MAVGKQLHAQTKLSLVSFFGTGALFGSSSSLVVLQFDWILSVQKYRESNLIGCCANGKYARTVYPFTAEVVQKSCARIMATKATLFPIHSEEHRREKGDVNISSPKRLVVVCAVVRNGFLPAD